MTSFEQEQQRPLASNAGSVISAAQTVEKIYDQIEALRREVMKEELVADDHEDPQDTEETTLEFLSALSHQELLDTAVDLYLERDALYRKQSRQPDLKKLEAFRDQFVQAIEEIKKLREENDRLQDRLRQTPSPRQDIGVVADVESDWETQKSQWLNRLTSKAVEAAPVTLPREDLTNKRLQAVINSLKQENTKLRVQLQKKSASEEILEADEIVLTERQRLVDLQHEWQEKIRTGELELSRDRAEVARKQAQLDERESRLELLKEQLERQQKKIMERPGGWRGLLGS